MDISNTISSDFCNQEILNMVMFTCIWFLIIVSAFASVLFYSIRKEKRDAN